MKSKQLILILSTMMLILTVRSLDSNNNSTLSSSDFLVSTLGHYRLRLLGNCSLQLQEFNTSINTYGSVSVIDVRKSDNNNCAFLNLSIEAQAILDSSGKTFLSPTKLGQQYNRFKLKLNDVGSLYLLSFFQGPDNQIQYQVDQFYTHPTKESRFLYSLQTPLTYKNKNNWQFTNSQGNITIRKNSTSPNTTTLTNLQGYQLLQTGLADPQGEIRYANIPGMAMQPKATKGCAQTEGVFAEFDEYWPVMRIYDEDKYLIAQYGVEEASKQPCPEKTFREGGKCVAKCSDNLYTEIDGSGGECVIRCQSTLEEKSRTCNVPNPTPSGQLNLNLLLGRKCPAGSTQYAYGCSCLNSKYYDFDNNICVTGCPIATFGLAGLCMKCPSNCKTCQLNSQKTSLLSCTSCSEGFGKSDCSVKEGTCQNITNCAECSKDSSGQEICNRCLSFFALSINKKKCQYSCASDETIAVGSGAEAYCTKVTAIIPGKPQDYISGVYKGEPYLIRKSGTCPGGRKVHRAACLTMCPPGTSETSDDRCICRVGMATINNQNCYNISEIIKNELGLYYNSSLNSFLNCPVGCISCDSNSCFECSPSHVLVVSGSSSVCRQDNLHFNCESEFYTHYSSSRICIANNLLNRQSNITNCSIEYKGRCLACKEGSFLSDLQCKSNCGQGYSGSYGRCIKSLPNCHLSVLTTATSHTAVDDELLNTLAYRTYSSNRMEISNDPFTQILVVRSQLGIPSTSPITATIHTPQITCKVTKSSLNPPDSAKGLCSDPSKPYLLPSGGCAQECPTNTYATLSGDKKSQICTLFSTVCSQKNASTPFRLEDGTCAASCPSGTVPTEFGNGSTVECHIRTQCQSKNIMTPFQLSDSNCSSACPLGTFPSLVGKDNLTCVSQSGGKKIHIDSSVFDLGGTGGEKRKMFYFVVDGVLNLSDIMVNYYKRAEPKLGQKVGQAGTQNNIDFTQFTDKTYLAINSTADEVVLDLSKNIKQFRTSDGKMLGSSIYGVSAEANRIQNTHSWLAIIAYVLSLLLIILHSIYVGNELLYKVDNVLIFAQTMYFFSFVHLLINASIGQFYYGFFWSHFGFFPNYFLPTIPPNYMEGNLKNQLLTLNFLPNSYRLLTGDANFIRNAGFSFSLLATFVCAFVVIVVLIWVLNKICRKNELWYGRVAKQALIAGFEFASMNIFYWAVAHLLCNRNTLFSGVKDEPVTHSEYRKSCSFAAIAWICVYGVYMVGRLVKNKIGGLYMFKRLATATILAGSAYQNNGIDNYQLFFIALVLLEFIFASLRVAFQQTYLRRQKVFIFLQAFLMIVAYATIYWWNDTGFVSIFVSLVLFFFIFLFTADLMDVYLDNRDQFYDDSVKLILPGLRQKQTLTSNDYQKIANPLSQPESDRRLRYQ